MMDRLRDGANNIAIKIILGVIILSFALAGVSSYLIGGGNNSAAKVDGQKISRSVFEQAYQNERNRMQSQMGNYFSTLLSDPSYVASLRRSVLDRMVNDVLLEQHAASVGLRVTDQQVKDAILEIPQFKSDGKFDAEVYQSTLRRAGYTPESFAAYLRSELLRNQVMNALQASEFSLPNEAKSQAALIAQTREIHSITLDLKNYQKNVSVTDKEIEAYYQAHQENYMRPEQFKIAYLQLSASDLKKEIQVTDKEIQAYYNDHLDQYSTKAQRQVSHILVKDEKKAEDLLAKIKAGADFAALAKKESQDPGSAKQGGKLDWFEHGVMDPAFEKTAFDLKKVGDISGIVKSNFGYHIIKLDGIRAAKVKSLDQVKDKIITAIQDEKAVDQFYKLQNTLEKVAFESPDSLDDAAKAIHVGVKKTDFVALTDLPPVLQSEKVQNALKNSDVRDEGLNSSVIEVAPENVVVVRVDESRPEAVRPLTEVRDQVVQTISHDKAKAQAEKIAKAVLEGLAKGDNKVLVNYQLKWSETKTIDRRSPLASSVFKMKKPEGDNVVYGQTKDQDGNIVIVQLTKVNTVVDDQMIAQLSQQLDQMGSQQDIDVLLKTLRQDADIQYYLASQ